jgi:hypothetical protein
MVQVFNIQNVEMQSKVYLVKNLPELLYIVFEKGTLPRKYTEPRNSSTRF